MRYEIARARCPDANAPLGLAPLGTHQAARAQCAAHGNVARGGAHTDGASGGPDMQAKAAQDVRSDDAAFSVQAGVARLGTQLAVAA